MGNSVQGYNAARDLAALSWVSPPILSLDDTHLGDPDYVEVYTGTVEFTIRPLDEVRSFYYRGLVGNHAYNFPSVAGVSQTIITSEDPIGETFTFTVTPTGNRVDGFSDVTSFVFGAVFTPTIFEDVPWGQPFGYVGYNMGGDDTWDYLVGGFSYTITSSWIAYVPIDGDTDPWLTSWIGSDGLGRIPEVAYKPEETYYNLLMLNRPTGLTDPTSGPTVKVQHNGVEDSTFELTVTNIDDGIYSVTGTVPSTYVDGDTVTMFWTAIYSTYTFGLVFDHFKIEEKTCLDIDPTAALTTIDTEVGIVDGVVDDIEAKVDIIDGVVDSILAGMASLGTPPAENNVREGVTYGIDSVGTLDLPAVADVKLGVVFDGETKTGTYESPYETMVVSIEDI